MAFLEVEDLALHYASPRGVVRALEGVSLVLSKGETLGLVGESGSGKSSLALALMRLLPRNVALFRGKVFLEGTELMGLPLELFRREVRWRRMALVLQGGRGLNPVLRVGDQVVERLLLEGVPKAEAWRRAGELLRRVGLPEGVQERYPFELSGGMRQRVLLAMALTLNPSLLLLDEPTSALDVSLQAQVVNLLKELKEELGLSLVFITHDLALASELADSLAVLYAGRVVEVGKAVEVLTSPAHPYTRGLLASLPRLRGHVHPQALEGIPPDPAALPPGCAFAPRCPWAMARCHEEVPPLFSAPSGQAVRCWLYGSDSAPPPPLSLLAIPPPSPSGTQPKREPLLRLEGVRVHFRARRGLGSGLLIRAVDGVTLSLYRGETLALVGESGSGKSTLGRASLRLVPLAEGRVIFAGEDVSRLSGARLKAFRRRAQAVFQDPYAALSPYMRVYDLVEEPLLVHGFPSKERRERILHALEQVGLSPAQALASRFPHTLSGGQRQRVALARALVLEPDFLLADEPLSMVDASSRAALLNLLRQLQEAQGLTLLYITHDLATARLLAHRVAVMYLGRVVELAPTHRLLESPFHPYTHALLEAVPEPDPRNPFRRRMVLHGEPPNPARPPLGCPFHPRCPRFMPGLCDTIIPELTEVAPGHEVACHLYPKGQASPKGEGLGPQG